MKKILFTNDIFNFVPQDAEEVMNDIESFLRYLNTEELTETAEMLKMENPETADEDEIADAYYEADPALQKEIADDIKDKAEEAMMLDSDYLSMREEEEYELLNSDLHEEGLLQHPEPYLIFGGNMGWRHLSGYKLTDDISKGEDLVSNLHGDYDYTVEVSKEDDKPYLEATVWTHDAPMGESYTIIPMSWMEKALKTDIEENIKMAAFANNDVRDAIREGVPALVKGKEALIAIKDFVMHEAYWANQTWRWDSYTYRKDTERQKEKMAKLSHELASFNFAEFKKDIEEENIRLNYDAPFEDYAWYAFTNNGNENSDKPYDTGKYHIPGKRNSELEEKITEILVKNNPADIEKMISNLFAK